MNGTRTSNKGRNVFVRMLTILLVLVMTSAAFSISVFAEESGGKTVNLGKGKDGKPVTVTVPEITEAEDSKIDGFLIGDLYISLIHAFQDGLATMTSTAFTNIENVVKDVNAQVSVTPDAFEKKALGMSDNKVFKLVKDVAKDVMVPIAAIIAVLLILYEFICALTEKNGFEEFDMAVTLRFILKTVLAIWFLASVFDIVNAILGLGVIISNGISGETMSIDLSGVSQLMQYIICGTSDDPEKLDGIGLGTGISLFFPILLLQLVSFVIFICSYFLLIGRMMEIYLHIAVSPIPFATITNKEFGDAGKNFIKTLLAYVLHGAFIMLCCGMFCAFVSNIGASFALIKYGETNLAAEIGGKLLEVTAFGALMIFAMFKSSGIAKTVVGAH